MSGQGQPKTSEGQAPIPTEPEFRALVQELAQSWIQWANLRLQISSIQGKAVTADDPLGGHVKKHVTASFIATLAEVEKRQADLVGACRRLRKAGTAASWLDALDPEIETSRRQLQEVREELEGLRSTPRQGLDLASARREEVLVPEEWRLTARIHAHVEQLLMRLTQEALAGECPATSGEKGA